MPFICCFGDKKDEVTKQSTFRERLPDHIKKLTVDVTYTNTEIQPKCVPTPKERRFTHYDSDSDSD